MNHAFRFTAEKIAHRLDLVRDHRFPQMQPLPPFRLNWMRDALAQPDFEGPTDHLPEIAPGTYWAGVDQHFALHSHFTLPEDWHQPALWMPFGSMGDVFNHPEALVWIDGVAVGSADRHHHLISLGQAVKPGPHRLTLAGWTGWAGWPPDPAAQDRLIMRPAFVVERDPALEAFLTLAACTWETATLPGYEAHLREALLDALDRAFVTLDTRDPIGAAFFASAPGALAGLERDLKAAGAPAEQKLLAIGHAHIDIGYLWPVMESRAKNARTYTNVLNLMRQNGDYRFSHSQAQLYAMTEVDQPELFAEIKTRVAEGRWEVLGGMWVEPDTNMPGAEALVRQITIGRHWFAQAFGADAETPVLWLPDTFGFAWCLPQLMAQSGLKMLITSKLNWNQHNPTPWSTFQWQGIDGTRVPVHILTTPRPVDHLPFPTNYKSDLSAAEVHGTLTAVRGAPLPALPICYGYGDGGGGPTKALIARARAFAAMPGMPQMGMGRVSDLVDLVLPLADSLPVIDDELYMEGHRGVLTGQGWIKRANREAEAALHRAELVAVLAGQQQIPEELTQAWQLLCLNQFHDIITGTCIPQVMADARTDMAEIMRLCGLAEARHQPDAGALGILNPSTCARADVAFTEAALPEDVPHQKVAGGALIGLPEMPAYGAVPLNTARIGTGVSAHIEDGVIHLENAHFSCEIGADGTLHSMHDRRNQRTLLAPGTRGNQLWAFEDRPLVWDAWDIEPYFEDRGEEIRDVERLEIVETGPLRASVRLRRRYRDSVIEQDIQLSDNATRLDFATHIIWHDRHVLLKAAFPASITAPTATYGIQWGHIERPTTRDTSHDASRFEVCAQKWAALHDGGYAVALLNDCKYGHDIAGNLMRLTLLKSSTSPDPQADQGSHRFTYSFGGFAEPGFIGVRAAAEAMNHPILIAPGIADVAGLVAADDPAVVIETIKPAEDGGGYVVRLYESEGKARQTTLRFLRATKEVWRTDLLEQAREPVEMHGHGAQLSLKAFEIVSLFVVPA